ncbi:phosphoribosylformylglycinamidine synthase [Marinicella meishanensis]|uniref:phosphoribosylformylglycinamidine synthase n=1 Tax=Marinicella meishanensis TaxID=2873263 RepID=UPI001CBC9745|nr:phosphoribosylformylglycinamidine synthase [Marinicella sp. NBU2979]
MTYQLLTFVGADVYSPFRLKKINQELQDQSSQQALEQAQHYYVVEVDGTLDEAAIEQVGQLLTAQLSTAEVAPNQVLVMPRPGTISPWSTKATDIFKHCGLDAVTRVEAGRLMTVSARSERVDRLMHDRMTEGLYAQRSELRGLFDHHAPKPVQQIDLHSGGKAALVELNQSLGLALSAEEIDYLYDSYMAAGKMPTDVELMMFAQANSEHCRHKIFNADWQINGEDQPLSLFKMIKNTEAKTSAPATSAYKDNAAVFAGGQGLRMTTDADHQYRQVPQDIDVLIKVETHNHPTGIEPFAGAATGSGGEIRDEAATGQGARPKAGLCGFSVSHLHIPGHPEAWEQGAPGTPSRMATAFEIMQKGPIGAAAFNNEFGRPNICGYFRNFTVAGGTDHSWRGYHKPIMLAGGLGNVNRIHGLKQDTQAGDHIVVLGGPAMLIGLGGGAASSISSADGQEALDFASVQRGNPEMQRRCQEVIDRCWYQQTDSPIRSIHDVGAGGLSNAIPEILDDAALGGEIELRRLQIDHVSMSPMEVWCNESQERYVLSIKPEKLAEFEALCQRERCPYAVMGQATARQTLQVNDAHFNNSPVDIPMSLLFGNTPKTQINIERQTPPTKAVDLGTQSLEQQVQAVLSFPTVASKKYLITIGDRTVSGLIHRDQMVGPWQVPVADCGITLRDYESLAGEAMAVGERTPLALINPAASARMAVSEAITNLLGVGIERLSDIKLSANWMAASAAPGEFQALFEAVKAVGMELCPALDIGIPVGKDSMSMQTSWQDGDFKKTVTAPMSLVVSAFAPVTDVSRHLTPQLSGTAGHELWLLDLSAGKHRLGGSVLYQTLGQMGQEAPDLDDPQALARLFALMNTAVQQRHIVACHDRSDGGLLAALAEMAFAGHCGVQLDVASLPGDDLGWLFAEEPGVVVEVPTDQQQQWQDLLAQHDLAGMAHRVGQVQQDPDFVVHHQQGESRWALSELEAIWSQVSHRMAAHRDNPEAAQQEHDLIQADNPGIQPLVNFEFEADLIAHLVDQPRPKLAVLREQGVNGHNEMAAAFMRAGFDCVDVHMQDLIDQTVQLGDFTGLVACGGFSYGDVLGAGLGWAKTILFNPMLRAQFSAFFADESKFTLGVCNGCQMLSGLRAIIPDTDHWPDFLRNDSEQFEARFSQLLINDTDNVFFAGMAGAQIPVAIAHGEGRASYGSATADPAQMAAQYVDNHGQLTQQYPFNPNGSDQAVAAVSGAGGRVLAMMPHPERVFRTVQMSCAPASWGENSPWMRMFYNARLFVG